MSHDYDAAAEWAEHDMKLPKNSQTALRGEAAADFGRDLIEHSRGVGLRLTRKLLQARSRRCARCGYPALSMPNWPPSLSRAGSSPAR